MAVVPLHSYVATSRQDLHSNSGERLEDDDLEALLGDANDTQFLAKERSVIKIMQTECGCGMLLRYRSGDNTSYVIVRADTATCLQVVERTTSECTAEAFRRASMATQASRVFGQRTRILGADRYAANFAAESQP